MIYGHVLASREEIRINYCLPEVCFVLLHYLPIVPSLKYKLWHKCLSRFVKNIDITVPWLELASVKLRKHRRKNANEEGSYYSFHYDRATSKTNSHYYGERKERQVKSNIRGTQKIPQKRLFSPLTTRPATLQLLDRLYLKNKNSRTMCPPS